MTAALVTIAVAVIGYIGTYGNNLRLAQRERRLERINRQLAELYGPLLARIEANHRAVREVLTTKADLLIGSEMPDILMELYIFSAFDEIELPGWTRGDRRSLEQEYPNGAMTLYVRECFNRLKGEQADLLGGSS
jgi:hypothetical protein